MDIQKAKLKLEAARRKQSQLRKQIDRLRLLIFEAGENPDDHKTDLTQRNKQFYIKWKEGMTFSQIAEESGLTEERIRVLCKRIEKILSLPHHVKHEVLKDLLHH